MSTYEIDMVIGNPVADKIRTMYRYLKHIPLKFYEWDSPFYYKKVGSNRILDSLTKLGKYVGIDVDKELCSRDPTYTNYLHQIYENSYNGDPVWLEFHEHIHLYEISQNKRTLRNLILIDYREKSGLLNSKFEFEWSRFFVTKIKKGDVVVQWAELGKCPYKYWIDQEPNDIVRLCQLAKPWLELKAQFYIATEDIDFLSDMHIEEFESWWANWSTPWCHHWNIPKWGPNEIAGNVVIGKILEIDKVTNLVNAGVYPVGII